MTTDLYGNLLNKADGWIRRLYQKLDVFSKDIRRHSVLETLLLIMLLFGSAAFFAIGGQIFLTFITMSIFAAHSGIAHAARHYLVTSAYVPGWIQLIWGIILEYYPPFLSNSTDAFAFIQDLIFTVVVGSVMAAIGIQISLVAFLALFSYGIMKIMEVVEKTTFKYLLILLGTVLTIAGQFVP